MYVLKDMTINNGRLLRVQLKIIELKLWVCHNLTFIKIPKLHPEGPLQQRTIISLQHNIIYCGII
jgi:hypothetical protein